MSTASVFFFSSRRRHTSFSRDWSSDVCSSDLFTPNIDVFIGIRVFMALGGCIGMITSKAIVRDLFPPEDTARIFSILMLIMEIGRASCRERLYLSAQE